MGRGYDTESKGLNESTVAEVDTTWVTGGTVASWREDATTHSMNPADSLSYVTHC